jgi:RNA polymerase sigma-70 factor (ECF subfamily)
LKQRTDEQLLADYLAGDRAAFTGLIERYQSELYNYLLKFLRQPALAEDVFQESFLQVHISAESFQADRRFRPWLYTIATNKARDMLRKQKRRQTIQITSSDEDLSDGQLWDSLLQDETTPEDVFARQEEKELVREAVEKLPDHLREILILAYFQQVPYKEMSEILDVPLGTVKSRLHAAVKGFAKVYNEITAEKAD